MNEIMPNTPNPVREDEYYEQLAAKLGIPASAIPHTPVWRNEEELAALVQLFTNMQGGGSNLPSTETASAGDVLSLDDDKKPQWAAPSGGGVLVVHDVDGTLDKTWQEISDTIENGTIPYVIIDEDGVKHIKILSEYSTYENDGATVYYVVFGINGIYETDSENGYPSASYGGGGAA